MKKRLQSVPGSLVSENGEAQATDAAEMTSDLQSLAQGDCTEMNEGMYT